MMKVFIALLWLLFIVPVSIATMIHGWGLTPENWGWIIIGYMFMLIPAFIEFFD